MSLSGGALVALLVAGHLIADFLLQPDRLLAEKRRARGFLLHLGIVGACHALLLTPFLRPRTLLVLGGLVVAHGLIDLGKAAMTRRQRSPAWLAADQSAHAATLAGAAWLLLGRGGVEPLWDLSPEALRLLRDAAIIASAYAVNWHGGAAIVAGVLDRYHLGDREEVVPGTGKAIGILERMLILTLVLLGQWGALGLVFAAKSIARYDELKVRRYAEYYLIGTLTSVLVAVATGLLADLLLRL